MLGAGPRNSNHQALDQVEDLTTEEVRDGALFKVKWKPFKTQAASPGRTAVELDHTMTLLAAPLKRLFLELVINRDSVFCNVFLATYRAFTTTQYILEEIISQLNTLPIESYICDTFRPYQSADFHSDEFTPVALASCNLSPRESTSGLCTTKHGWRARNIVTVVKIWIKGYPEDFREQESLCDLLRQVVSVGCQNTYLDPNSILAEITALQGSISLGDSTTDLNLMGSVSRSTSSSSLKEGTLVRIDIDSGPTSPGVRSRFTSASESDDVVSTVPWVADSTPLPIPQATAPEFVLEYEEFLPANVATELTRISGPLFTEVRPYECLASTWSKRGRVAENGERIAASITSTIDQFNRLCSLVMTSILAPPQFIQDLLELGAENFHCHCSFEVKCRASAIQWWISVAQDCRYLKDYSSLRAILSTLKSSSIERLSDTWQHVDKEKMLIFTDLSELNSTDRNEQNARELLTKEGTAKNMITPAANSLRESQSTSWHKRLRNKSRESCSSFSGHSSLSESKSLSHSPRGPPTLSRAQSLRSLKPVRMTSRSSSRSSYTSLASGLPPSPRVSAIGVVPYLGLFLTDLQMIDAAHSDFVPARHKDLEKDVKLVNFVKRRKEFEVLAQISLFQKQASSYSYRNSPIAAIREWLLNSDVMEDAECYKMSLMLEKKGMKPSHPAADNELSPTKDKIMLTRKDTGGQDFVPELPRTALGSDDDRHDNSTMQSAVSSSSVDNHSGVLMARVAFHSSVATRNSVFQGILVQNDGTKARNIIEKVVERHGMKLKADEMCLYQVITATRFLLIPLDANLYYAIDASEPPLRFYLQPKSVKPPKKVSNAAFGSGFSMAD